MEINAIIYYADGPFVLLLMAFDQLLSFYFHMTSFVNIHNACDVNLFQFSITKVKANPPNNGQSFLIISNSKKPSLKLLPP